MEDLLSNENSSLRIWYFYHLIRSRSCSVYDINRSKNEHGEFHHLYHQLREHPDKFHSYFRMSIPTFDYVFTRVEGILTKNWTNFNLNPINPVECLAVTLRYLATGASFQHLGFTFRMGSTTVCSIVHETVEAIWDALSPIHMPVPTEALFKAISQQYYEKWNFPLCLGAIDGKYLELFSSEIFSNHIFVETECKYFIVTY